MRNRMLITLLGAMSLSLGTYADNFEFCHADVSEETGWYGTGKRDTYDVAIRVADAGLAGYRIVGLKVPFRGMDYVSGLKGWLSEELILGKDENDKKVNMPDIASVSMNYADGWLTAIFDTPYELTDRGVYAGYTFTVNDIATDKAMTAPVAVGEGKDTDALYIHTNRTYTTWQECSSSAKKKSRITLLLEGELPKIGVGLRAEGPLYCEADGDVLSVPVEFVMHGSQPLESLGLSYSISGQDGKVASGDVTMELPAPVTLQFGHACRATAGLPESLPKGVYTLSLSVTDVNGVSNNDASATSEVELETLSQVPVHRPLMEEYTGLWCGNCPRGYASMEHMTKKYPDDFIAIAYHNRDDMQCVTAYANAVSGFPAGWLDRTLKLDPYFGQAPDGYGFEDDWLEARARFTPIALSVSAAFDDSDPDIINVECDVSLVRDSDTEYRVAYMLLADGLSNDKWSQSNYFVGSDEYGDIEEMEMFVNGTSSMKGLVYNDVIVGYSPLRGVAGSLPVPMEVDRKCHHSYKFKVSECTNLNGDALVSDRSKLRVVAIVTENGDGVANAAVASVMLDSGIADINDAGVVSTEYRDLCGNPVMNPGSGIYVRIDKLSDGSIAVTKVALP